MKKWLISIVLGIVLFLLLNAIPAKTAEPISLGAEITIIAVFALVIRGFLGVVSLIKKIKAPRATAENVSQNSLSKNREGGKLHPLSQPVKKAAKEKKKYLTETAEQLEAEPVTPSAVQQIIVEPQVVVMQKQRKVAWCPRCGSESLSGHKKGFGIGKAVLGMAATNNLFGLVAGNFRAKKVRVTCMNCGKSWKAGKKRVKY